MLRFGSTTLIAVAMLLFAIVADVLWGVPWYVYAALVLAYSLILFYGCYYVGSNFFIPIVCAAKTNEKEIAITFDDGPASATTSILQVLKEHNIKAAFFCIGSRIAGNEHILRQLYEEGHLIGNHSFSHHFWFDMYGSAKMLADLRQMDEETNRVLGIQPKLFRPPYGVTNPNLKKAIIVGHYTPVGWSVRSMDTVIKDRDQLLEKINNKLKPGAIFLFHDTSTTTLAVLPAFLKHVKDNGYKIVRVDQLLNIQAYA